MLIAAKKKTQAELDIIAAKQELSRLSSVISGVVSNKIRDYNDLKFTEFGAIHSLGIYTIDPLYTHYTFVTDLLGWNQELWETAELMRESLLSGLKYDATWVDIKPTAAELVASLPDLDIAQYNV